MSTSSEQMLTRASLAVSVLALVFAVLDVLRAVFSSISIGLSFVVQFGVFMAVLLALFYGNVVYHLTRSGQLRRRAGHVPVGRDELEAVFDHAAPPRVCVLVPSYKEERQVVLQTVLSAALAEYPNRSVTVLIDDPPHGSGPDRQALEETRRMIRDLNRAFAAKAGRFRVERARHAKRLRDGSPDLRGEALRLADLYEEAAALVEEFGRDFDGASAANFAHADRLFVEAVICAPAAAHRARGAALRRDGSPDPARIAREYRRLATLFAVEITSFERKLYENLSHQPNKAMNLNSYIGLIGRAFRAVPCLGRLPMLEECPAETADFAVPHADYVLTLDADSIILPDYILKLVHLMEADEGLAVAQTPYSAFPGAPTALERVAGATTDIQYLVHQGFTAFGATFWVGANALLRLEALEDIRGFAHERGHRVPVYIQDRTVIEDTGSTIDLARKGWRLFNHPERLAYSATPPDFGALVIQRRRWANGGLIIFPDLLRLAFGRYGRRPGAAECWLRAHYLLSPALANFALLIPLLYPFDAAFMSLWLPLAALPYYVLYGRDLRQIGYGWSDLMRVYALTLLLVPVNLAGVFRSIQQLVTGRKSAFGRTPKVEGRTAMPALHVLFQGALLALALGSCAVSLVEQRYLQAVFSALNAGLMIYGLTVLIGWQEAYQDVRLGLAPKRTEIVPAGAVVQDGIASQRPIAGPASRLAEPALARDVA